jgi:hypothetical protein
LKERSLWMKNLVSNNLLSVVVGIVLIFTCFLIAYFFQKHLFSKYRAKAENADKNDDNQY